MDRMLVVCDRGIAARQQLCQSLLAVFEWFVPQIVALQFNQVKRDQGDVIIVTTGAECIEIGNAVIAANHRLAIDQERRRLNAVRGVNDDREAVRPVRVKQRTREASRRNINR
jgi:hypothetical protein